MKLILFVTFYNFLENPGEKLQVWQIRNVGVHLDKPDFLFSDHVCCCCCVSCWTFVEIYHEDKANNAGNIQITTEKGLQVFTYKQLHSATGGFSKSNVVGRGAFGLVYRGVLQNGRKVAVKLMDQAGKQGEDEFTAEVWYLC